MPDKVQQYYEYLKRAGADVPQSVQSFKQTLSNEGSAKQYYNYLRNNNFDAPDTYESFAGTLGIAQPKQPAVDPAVQQRKLATEEAMGLPLRKQQPFYETLPKQQLAAGVPAQFKAGFYEKEKTGDDNLFSIYETANYNQRQVMNTTINKGVPSEYITVNTGKSVAEKIPNPKKQEYNVYEKQKGDVLKEMAPFVDKTINSLLESGEYKNFFTTNEVFDEGKARDYFDKFVTERGGGRATRELLLSKFRGEAKNKLQQDDPAYQKILAEKIKANGVDFKKYSQQHFNKLAQPFLKNAEAITKEAEANSQQLLEDFKPLANAATEAFNLYVGGLNEQVKTGQMPEAQAKELYGQKLDEYNKQMTGINNQYKEMVQKMQASANNKYLGIERSINKIISGISSSEVFANLPKEEQEKIKKAYSDASVEYYQLKNNIQKVKDEYGNIQSPALLNIISKGLSSGWNRGLSGIGNYLQKQGHDGNFTKWLMSKETDANVLAPAQYEWSKDEWYKRVAGSTSTSIGASAPILLPTIAVGSLTGGTTLPGMITGAIATGATGFLGETIQNTGDVYKQILEQTGDENKALAVANEFERKQAKTMPLYFIGGLGSVALLKSKGIIQKLAGAGLEQIEEIPTEYYQSFTEAQATQGYNKDFATFVKENPEIAADTFFSTLGQSGAFAATGKMINSIIAKAPQGDKQLFADMIQKEGLEFAINVLDKYKQTGVINEADFNNGVIELQKVNELLRSFDNMGVSGDKAKALLTLNYQAEAIKKKIEDEKMPAVKIMYEQQLRDVNEKIKAVNTEDSYAVVTLPGGEGATMTIFADDLLKMEQDGTLEDFIQKSDGITSNDPKLNKILNGIKERVGNPVSADDGAYVNNITQKTEGYEQGIGITEDARIETRQPTQGEGTGTEREGAATQTDDSDQFGRSKEKEVAEEIRQAIRDGKFKGLPVETANNASDADLIDFIYEQATITTPSPETGEPITSRSLLDKTFGAELVDRVIASKGQVEQPRVTVSPTESYESFLNEMMDFVSIVKDGSFEYRLNIPNMAQKERDGAIKDIRAGKSSKRRSDFEAAVKSMWENKSVDVNRGKGAQSESTSIPFDDYFNQQDEDAADNEIMGTWIVPETEGWFDEEITNLNTENETGSNEQDAEGRSEQPEPETEVRGADATETGRVIDTPSSQDRGQAQEPPSEVTPPPETEGFERKPGKKSLLNRAYEGTTDAALKERIAEFGLDYERQTWDDARAISKQIIEQLGIESALDAVRKGMVKGAEAAFIWSEAIDAVGDEIATTTDPDALSKLQQYEAELLDEFDRTARNDGRFLSALQDIYKNSDFQYQLSRQIEEYKQRNKGEIPDDVRVKFEQLSKELEDVNKKLAAKEEELRVAQEKQAMEDIKEAVAREKPERKKSNKQKAKQVADAIRKGKIQRHGVFLSSSPASAVWDAALEATAKAIEAGGAVADAIKAGVAVIKQSDWYKSLVKGQQGEAEQTFTDYINETAAKEKPKPSIVNGKIQIPHELIRNLVESGIDNINDLTTAVLEELKADFPNITERQVRDAITNYGRVINPNREEVEVDIRKIKRVGRVLSALEDIAEKKRPLRSGLQRDKLDAEERVLQKELREALKTLPPDEAEEGRKLKTTLDGIKSRLKNQIEDIEREIATGEKRVAGKAEVEYDAEAKALREQRDELKRVRDEIFGDEITDEQRIQRAIRITQRAAEKLEEKIKANDLSAKQRTPVTSPALETERKRLAELREQMKQMRDEAGITEANRLTSAKKRVEKQTEQLRERLRTKDFAKRKRVEQKADNELIKLKAEKLRIQEEFDKEQYKAELKNRDTGTKIADAAIEAWGITRVLQATGELSYIGIQGGMYLRDAILHPIRTAKLIIESFQHFASEKRFKEWERHIKAQPYYPELKASKLALTEYDSKLTAREELGVSGWANRIWDALMLPAKLGSERLYEILKKANPLLKFERAAVSYLNNLRLIKFLEGKKKIESEGKTFQTHPESYKAVADVVNTFTGRASLGKAELIAKQLAIVLYSPRNWASILKQTTPLFFYKLYTWRDKGTFKPSVAQKMAISDYMKYFAFNGSLLLLAAAWANGDDDEETSVSFDPKSSDFLKLKIGDQRIDFLGGRSQMIVFQMRLLFDKKTSASGEEKHLGQDAYTPTRFDLALDLSLNKLAPTASLLTDYLRTGTKGEGEERKRVTRFGEEYSFTEAIKERTHPMFWGTVSEIHKDQPALVEAYMITLAAIGVNIQTQNNKKSIEAIMKEREQTKEAPKKTKAETLKEKREKRIKERELKARAAEEGIKYIKPQ